MGSETWGERGARAAAIAAGVAPYLGTIGHGFTLDDANTIEGHLGVKGPLSLENVFLRDWWGRSQFDTIGTWRPLATLTFWFDQRLGGGRSWAFHLTNLVLYAALLALAERFLARWCEGALSRPGRLVSIALFGVLAIHADVVPSPTGRAEILAALFSLGAVFAATCTEQLTGGTTAAAVLAIGCALLSKESATPMAVLVPLLAYRAHASRNGVPRAPLASLAAACFGLLAAVALFRATHMPFMSLGTERALENPLLAVNGPRRLLGACEVLALYLGHTFTGLGLAPDYSFSEPPLLREGPLTILVGGLVVVAFAALLLRSWRNAPRLADALLGFGASYVAVSNFLTPASAIADRLFFFPSFWLVLVIALLVERTARLPATRAFAFVAAVLFALWIGARSARYAALWKDDLTLLSAAMRAYPNVFRTQRNLAHALADAHEDEEAAWHLAVAEAIYAGYPSPFARDAIAPAWREEPLGARLDHLRDLVGAKAACAAASVAGARLKSWDAPDAAAALSRWRERGCPP
ncbi:MAG TPA: hypothetical protein VGI39_45355 [Polyangiaceae bacterium]